MLSGNDIMRLMQRGAEDGLEEAAREILNAAKADAPPTDPKDDPSPESLRESGRVVAEHGGRSVRIEFDVPYAAKQHEAQHFKHPRGGSAKFLERNVKAKVDKVGDEIASKVRARLGAGH